MAFATAWGVKALEQLPRFIRATGAVPQGTKAFEFDQREHAVVGGLAHVDAQPVLHRLRDGLVPAELARDAAGAGPGSGACPWA
jgi:hypothetical protein